MPLHRIDEVLKKLKDAKNTQRSSKKSKGAGILEFLRAMNPAGRTTRRKLATRLKKSSGSISTYKKRLIEAGVIEEPLQGHFEFALPRFGEYVVSLG